MTQGIDPISGAQVVLPCGDLDPTLEFFTQRLGFRVRAIHPADDPTSAVIVGHGLAIRLERVASGDPGRVRLECEDPSVFEASELVAPNGTRIEIVHANPPLELPEHAPNFVITRMGADANWGTGRAGMQYRDLIPDRQSGRIIASHIRIPGGGPVPDYAHFHRVRFQMIYCYRGWVRVVYEDQGEPFVLEPGDCVLQPPQIRHRVLESSEGLEVIEIGSPAEHETFGDLEMELPTGKLDPTRDFGGQRFVRHVASKASWEPWRLEGFEFRDTGIADATDGLAGVRVVRPAGAPSDELARHDAELLFLFVLEGSVTLHAEGRGSEGFRAGDCVVLPSGMGHRFSDCSADLEILDVTLPAKV